MLLSINPKLKFRMLEVDCPSPPGPGPRPRDTSRGRNRLFITGVETSSAFG